MIPAQAVAHPLAQIALVAGFDEGIEAVDGGGVVLVLVLQLGEFEGDFRGQGAFRKSLEKGQVPLGGQVIPTLSLLGKYTLSNIRLADNGGNILFGAAATGKRVFTSSSSLFATA